MIPDTESTAHRRPTQRESKSILGMAITEVSGEIKADYGHPISNDTCAASLSEPTCLREAG